MTSGKGRKTPGHDNILLGGAPPISHIIATPLALFGCAGYARVTLIVMADVADASNKASSSPALMGILGLSQY